MSPSANLMNYGHREKFARLAISAMVVALVYWTARLSAPSGLFFGHTHGRLAWMTLCYTLIGIFFLIYVALSAAIRWTAIPIGAVFGCLAGAAGHQIQAMMPELPTFFVPPY